jgi:hypothetical protein
VSRAIVAAFVKGLSAASIGQAVASVGLAGLTVGIFIAFRSLRLDSPPPLDRQRLLLDG